MLYATEIKAIDPLTKELRTFAGPQIEADSEAEADYYCQANGLGYCSISGLAG